MIKRSKEKSNLKLALTYYRRGNSHYGKGDYDKAIDDYNKAIKLNPEDAAAIYRNRGNAYYDKGDYDKAIDDYNKAIGLNPKDAIAYRNRGNAYYDRGDYDKAIDGYTKAIKLNPKDAASYGNLGNIYDDKGKYDQAIDNYKKAININKKMKQRDDSNLESLREKLANVKLKKEEKILETKNKEAQEYRNSTLKVFTWSAFGSYGLTMAAFIAGIIFSAICSCNIPCRSTMPSCTMPDSPTILSYIISCCFTISSYQMLPFLTGITLFLSPLLLKLGIAEYDKRQSDKKLDDLRKEISKKQHNMFLDTTSKTVSTDEYKQLASPLENIATIIAKLKSLKE